MGSILNFMFPGAGNSDRDSSQSSSTGTKRPDYLFILNSVCVFRGEENTIGVNTEIPRLELIYGAVPYLFGYSAVGFNVNLYALMNKGNGEFDTSLLKAFQLNIPEERLRMLLALLNLGRLLQSLADSPPCGRDEFRDVVSSNGVIVRLKPTFVDKTFPKSATYDIVAKHLKQVYAVLREHQVPHVDDLVGWNPPELRLSFQPRGIEIKQSNLSELFCALQNVLEALVKLHHALWMHRDIRWPNVIKRHDDSFTWFFIDFVDSASSPQPWLRGGVLSKEEHAPEIFLDDVEHTTAVDIWSVGYLIESSGLDRSWFDREDRTKFLEHLTDDNPSKRPNAEEALQTLKMLEQEYKRSQVEEPKNKKPKKK